MTAIPADSGRVAVLLSRQLVGLTAAASMAWLGVGVFSLSSFTVAFVWTFARLWRSRSVSRSRTMAMIGVTFLVPSAVMVLALIGPVAGQVLLAGMMFGRMLCTFTLFAVAFADVSVRTGYHAVRARALTA